MAKIRLCFPFRVQETMLPSTRADLDRSVRMRRDELLFVACCTIQMLIVRLPMDVIDGTPVPRIIFTGQPHSFHGFLISLTLSCFGAVCSIYLHDSKPKVARRYEAISTWAMGAAFLVFLWASISAYTRWAIAFTLGVDHT